MTIHQGIAILLACPDHDRCTCAERITDGLPANTNTTLLSKAMIMVSMVIGNEWDEANELNKAFDAGSRGWMKRALSGDPISEKDESKDRVTIP